MRDAEGNVTGTVEKPGCCEGCGCGAMLVVTAAMVLLGAALLPSENNWSVVSQLATYGLEGSVVVCLFLWWRRSAAMKLRVRAFQERIGRLWKQ